VDIPKRTLCLDELAHLDRQQTDLQVMPENRVAFLLVVNLVEHLRVISVVLHKVEWDAEMVLCGENRRDDRWCPTTSLIYRVTGLFGNH
jgi:hypothetical protein